jgi:hypothetical protein
MGTKTTFICDCCLREADNNLGWARVSVNGASDGKRLMPDDNRDLCEICWSPLQTLMKKVHDEGSREAELAFGYSRTMRVRMMPTEAVLLRRL